MHQCSLCTAGSSYCSTDSVCIKCDTLKVHMCRRCAVSACGIIPKMCVSCTKRPHLCLSKCLSGCIFKENPTCRCNKGGPKRLQVKKDNKNKDRFYWSCEQCKFFEWDCV